MTNVAVVTVTYLMVTCHRRDICDRFDKRDRYDSYGSGRDISRDFQGETTSSLFESDGGGIHGNFRLAFV